MIYFAFLIIVDKSRSHMLIGTLFFSVYCTLVKQGTDEWKRIRSTARVTGSTVYTSIGLETLTAEQQHFDESVRGKSKKDHPNS